MNGGVNGGRICWAIAGTCCGGSEAATFASKHLSCLSCDFFKLVQAEEGASYTPLSRAETAPHSLIEQFESIASIIDSMSALVYVSDLDTHELLFLNQAGIKLFGEQCIGKPCFTVLQSGQASRCSFCTNDRLLADGKPTAPVVWEFQNTVTKRWYLCIDKAIRWWDGRMVRMEVATDITERKAAEQFHEQYVSLVSHDLRTPLSAILLRASSIQRTMEKSGQTEYARATQPVIDSARRMAAMLDDLVESARLEGSSFELKKTRVDLSRLVRDVTARMGSPEMQARIGLDIDDEIHVMSDEHRIQSVLENLISNSIRYSKDGTPVTVTLRARGLEAVLSVADSGVGIAEADVPNLFQRFYRAKSSGHVHGLGLGLYISRLVVEAHQGRIWVESVEGKGSTFHVALLMESSSAMNDNQPLVRRREGSAHAR
jgi:signal transduction histidine kinase